MKEEEERRSPKITRKEQKHNEVVLKNTGPNRGKKRTVTAFGFAISVSG